MAEGGDELRVQLAFVQQQQLRLGQDGGEGIGQVVPELRDRVVDQPSALEQGAVEVPQVMIPQVPHRLPEIRLAHGAENLSRGAFVLSVLGPEENPTPPGAILRPPDGETDGDTLPFELYGGEIMNDGRSIVGEALP